MESCERMPVDADPGAEEANLAPRGPVLLTKTHLRSHCAPHALSEDLSLRDLVHLASETH